MACTVPFTELVELPGELAEPPGELVEPPAEPVEPPSELGPVESNRPRTCSILADLLKLRELVAPHPNCPGTLVLICLFVWFVCN